MVGAGAPLAAGSAAAVVVVVGAVVVGAGAWPLSVATGALRTSVTS
jgi:hypothetical protein